MKNLIQKLLAHRHPWRYVGFDDLSELYTSSMLRSLGLSLIGVFIPIYLYKLGYSIPIICLFMSVVFLGRAISDVFAGLTVAKYGPKHTILISNLMQITALALLLTLSQTNVSLWLIAVIWGWAISFFFVAYHVDFSKIMHKDHGGKELGFMTVVERLGAAAGPIVGGLIATLFGAEYTIMVALALLMASTLPLFLTQEPTRTHQHISFRGLPYKKLTRDGISYFSAGIDNAVSVGIWPFFVALSIFTTNTYANVGIVTSLGIVTAIFAATFIGKVVDKNRGLSLYRWSVWANALVHIFRPFIGSFSGVLLVNVANEAVTTGFRMPFFKGMYARADELPGFRIVYIVFMEIYVDLAKFIAWLVLALLCTLMPPLNAMSVVFILASATSLLMLVQNFPSLRPTRLSGA
jgi:MFS family permease